MSARHPRPQPARRLACGRLLVIGLEADRWSSSLERRLRAWNPGGVLLTARNLSSPERAAEILARIARTLDRVPLLALEEEGGTSDPLRNFFPALPSARAAARAGAAAVGKLGELAAKEMKLLGFNSNFAPLLDLRTPASQAILGTRTFGSDPEQVTRCAKAFIAATRGEDILPCGKYFPGFGDARREPLPGMATVAKPMAALWREDLLPYRRLLPRLPLVLVSGAAYKAYDFDWARPVTRSAKVLEGLLRVKLKYRGLAMGEGGEAACPAEGLAQAAAEAVQAGCDLLLVREERAVEGFLDSLARGLDSHKLSPRRLEQALVRLDRVRRGLVPPRGRISSREMERLAEKIERLCAQCPEKEQSLA